MSSLRWIPKPAPPEIEVDQLRTAINASTILATVLAQRGLHTFNEVKDFFQPSHRQLHDPFLMKDMDRAVDRITTAINRGENILIYGDYDVDGTSAVALLYGFLIEQCDQVSYYIPDRYKEGYGISDAGISFAKDNEVTLIIALDCGIKALKQVADAQEAGIDFIICDHHLPERSSPVRWLFSILCKRIVRILSSTSVDVRFGFKLVQALCSMWDLDRSEAFAQVDLVAIATGADIVPMIGENRALAYLGLRSMEAQLRPGLEQLLERQGLIEHGRFSKSQITVSDLVFKIGPRINAAGRIDHGSIAVELLTARTTKSALKHAARLDEFNTIRKQEDERVKEEALAMIESDAHLRQARSTVVFSPNWHKGVVGIAASRLQDSYYRPTIVLTKSNGKITGSARSVRGFDVHEAIEQCSDLLVNFGGHPAAAGLTLEEDNLPAFIQRFEEETAKRLSPDQCIPTLEYEMELDLSMVQPKLVEQLQRLAPFGPKNPKPVFVSKDLILTERSRRVGEDRSHLKLEVHPKGRPDLLFSGIAFGQGEVMERWTEGEPVDLAYTLEWNEYRGKKSVQLVVRDIHLETQSASPVQNTVAQSNS